MFREAFYVIGISVRTTNEAGQAKLEIPALWAKFFAENVKAKIPNKIEEDKNLYCIYTDYEKDFTKPYTAFLGCKVAHLKDMPDGLSGKTIKDGDFACFNVTGDLSAGIVYDEWLKIWQLPLPRIYAADYEVYNENVLATGKGQVDIYIAVAK